MRIFRFMKGSRLIYLGAILAISASVVFAASIPVTMRLIIDSVIGDKPMELPAWLLEWILSIGGRNFLLKNFWVVCTVVVVLTAGHGIFMFLKGKLVSMASENTGKNIRECIYNHILHLTYDYHIKVQTGDLIQRCTSDIETIQNFISGQLVEVGQIVLSLSYTLFIMFSLDTRYAFVSIAMIPFILASTLRFFVKIQKVFKLVDEAEGRMSTTLQENLIGTRVVRAFAAQGFEIEKFDERNKEYTEYIKRLVHVMSNFWSVSDLLCMLQFSIVVVTGIYWASKGVITLGILIAFISYAGMLIWPIRHLGQILAFMGQAFVSQNRVQEILDEPMEPSPEDELFPEIKGEIEFKNVYFEYEKGNPVLKDVSLKIEKGQTIAILGSTGSGKSSLVHLLLRFYDYQKGSIKIDGIELRSINRKWLRKNIGIVLQEPFLFSKSIKDNIRLGRSDAHEKEIYEVSSIASIHNTIQAFAKGYDTIVGERGVTLSGGQKQRLAIARTIIRNTPILIFDDSLSAVDVKTDAAIRKALRQKSRDATTIIISHRIATLAEADMIYVLEDGKIKQCGTHDELVQKQGLYRRLWMMQNSLEEELVQQEEEGLARQEDRVLARQEEEELMRQDEQLVR